MVARLHTRIVVSTCLAVGLLPSLALAQNGTWVTSTTGTYNWSDAANWQAGVVADGAGNTASFTTAGLTGPVAVTLDAPRTLGNLVFDNPTNNYGWTVAGTNPLTLSSPTAGGPAIAVNNSAITATITAPLSAPAGWTKAGPGTLTLAGPTPYGGGITVAAGTLSVNGAAIAGGYLDGSGTVATDPTKGGRFVNVTSSPSVKIVSNSPSDQFTHYSLGGPLTIPGGMNPPAGSPGVTLNGFTIQGGGSLSVGALSRVSVSNFQSYGELTLDPSTPFITLVNLGTAPLGFEAGSRTFVGTPSPEGSRTTIDLHGQNAIVAGGLFVNNAVVSSSTGVGQVVADYGAFVKGAGFWQNPVVTQNGGKFQTGNSPGAASFGSLVLGPGGIDNYVLAINDATGIAGPSPDASGHVNGWGLIRAAATAPGDLGFGPTSGDFTWTATPAARLTVALQTLLNPTTPGEDNPGPMAHFDPTRSYTWPAAEWAGRYAGPTDAAALDAATVFDTSGFRNGIEGRFGWRLDAGANTVVNVHARAGAQSATTDYMGGVGVGCLANPTGQAFAPVFDPLVRRGIRAHLPRFRSTLSLLGFRGVGSDQRLPELVWTDV